MSTTPCDLTSLERLLAREMAGASPSYATLRRHASKGFLDAFLVAGKPEKAKGGGRQYFDSQRVLQHYRTQAELGVAEGDQRKLHKRPIQTDSDLPEKVLFRLAGLEKMVGQLAAKVDQMSSREPSGAAGRLDSQVLEDLGKAIQRLDSVSSMLMRKYDAENAGLRNQLEATRKEAADLREMNNLARNVSQCLTQLSQLRDSLLQG